MSNIFIEGNLNFFDVLNASLDDATFDTYKDICEITGELLTENFVTLECGHKFNYLPLYKDVYKQMFVFKTYDKTHLSTSNQIKYKQSGKDYFLRCPYCRDIQFSILPYYELDDVKLIYGFNSLDKTKSLQPKQNNNCINNSFISWDKVFTYETNKMCCYTASLTGSCYKKYLCKMDNTDKYYCNSHWRSALKMINYEEKQKKMEEKKKLLEEKKKLIEHKKNIIEEKKKIHKECMEVKKQFDEEKKKKRLAKIKDNNFVSNTVEGQIQIGVYNETSESETNVVQINRCTAILKNGILKGSQCDCKTVKGTLFCGRHIPRIKITTDNEEK
jgi:hypothetical protein